jgi:membrane fusion protein, heavy metal efflux system
MRYIFTLIFSLIILASCGNKEADMHEEHHDEAIGNTVTLKSSISANGMLTVPNHNKAHVTPLYSGVVQSLLIQPGNTVQKGQAIATIVNAELIGFQQELHNVNAQIELAETEYKRQKELVEGNAAPLKRLQQAEAELKSLKARKEGYSEQLRALGYKVTDKISSVLTITAPISGTVSTVNAEIGTKVDASSPIAEIVNNSELHLDLFVYEKDLPLLKTNQIIHFTLTNNPGVEYDAKIYSIGAAFVNETKTIPIHAMVEGDKTGLIEGMNITAVISLGDAVVPAVPSDAVVSLQGQDYIFIQTEAKADEHDHEASKSKEAEHTHPEGEQHDHEHTEEADVEPEHNEVTFERIPVRKGVTSVGYTEITPLKELPSNARIVTKGAFFLIAKMTNAGEAHEH